MHIYACTLLPIMLFCTACFCNLCTTRQLTELTSVGGSLDSIQQGIILGVESNGEGTVHNVSIDLRPKICKTSHTVILQATWRSMALMRTFPTAAAL